VMMVTCVRSRRWHEVEGRVNVVKLPARRGIGMAAHKTRPPSAME
jgi:hypothetical protein